MDVAVAPTAKSIISVSAASRLAPLSPALAKKPACGAKRLRPDSGSCRPQLCPPGVAEHHFSERQEPTAGNGPPIAAGFKGWNFCENRVVGEVKYFFAVADVPVERRRGYVQSVAEPAHR
jgi:hypothetical protein